MTTLENVQAALSAANMPITARELYDVNDHFDSIDDLSKALSKLVKTGRAKVCGMTSPPRGNARKLYQAVTEKDDDLDRQLAEAILERDQETAEAVIEPTAAIEPIIGACTEPEAVIEPHTERFVADDDCASGLRVEKLPERRYSLAASIDDLSIDLNPRHESDDPVIREIKAYREPRPRIQDGHRLAKHLYAGASVLQERLPGLATSMREAADALREFAA